MYARLRSRSSALCGEFFLTKPRRLHSVQSIKTEPKFRETLPPINVEYSDQVTGVKSDKDRPALSRMFESASKRQFDVLLIWSLDRLSREGVLPTLQYLNRLSSYGIEWRSLTEQYIDSCGIFADAVISIMAVIARQENVRRSERTKADLARAREKGKKLGRRRVHVNIDVIRRLRASGLSWTAIAFETGNSRASCQRAVQHLV